MAYKWDGILLHHRKGRNMMNAEAWEDLHELIQNRVINQNQGNNVRSDYNNVNRKNHETIETKSSQSICQVWLQRRDMKTYYLPFFAEVGDDTYATLYVTLHLVGMLVRLCWNWFVPSFFFVKWLTYLEGGDFRCHHIQPFHFTNKETESQKNEVIC